jgi:hypothetical protein
MKIKYIITILVLSINYNLFAGGPARTVVYLANFSGSDFRYKVNYISEYKHNNHFYFYDDEIMTLTGEFCDNVLTDEGDYNVDFNNISIMIVSLDEIENIKDFLNYYINTLDIYNSLDKMIYSFQNLESFKIIRKERYYDEYDIYCDEYYIVVDKINNSPLNYPYITVDNLNLREPGGLNSSVLAMLRKGEEIKIIDIGFKEKVKVENIYKKGYFPIDGIVYHFWVKVETKSGLVGWCYSYYLKAKNGT